MSVRHVGANGPRQRCSNAPNPPPGTLPLDVYDEWQHVNGLWEQKRMETLYLGAVVYACGYPAIVWAMSKRSTIALTATIAATVFAGTYVGARAYLISTTRYDNGIRTTPSLFSFRLGFEQGGVSYDQSGRVVKRATPKVLWIRDRHK